MTGSRGLTARNRSAMESTVKPVQARLESWKMQMFFMTFLRINRIKLLQVTHVTWAPLTPSAPAVPNCCCSKGSAPYWSNPPFLIFDIRALWRSGLSARAPECQKLKMAG